MLPLLRYFMDHCDTQTESIETHNVVMPRLLLRFSLLIVCFAFWPPGAVPLTIGHKLGTRWSDTPNMQQNVNALSSRCCPWVMCGMENRWRKKASAMKSIAQFPSAVRGAAALMWEQRPAVLKLWLIVGQFQWKWTNSFSLWAWRFKLELRYLLTLFSLRTSKGA